MAYWIVTSPIDLDRSYVSRAYARCAATTDYIHTLWVKKRAISLRHNFDNVDQISKFFHCWTSTKFAGSLLLYLSPHLKCVAAVPCEMQNIKNDKNRLSQMKCLKYYCAPLTRIYAWIRFRHSFIASLITHCSKIRVTHSSIASHAASCCSSTSRTFVW